MSKKVSDFAGTCLPLVTRIGRSSTKVLPKDPFYNDFFVRFARHDSWFSQGSGDGMQLFYLRVQSKILCLYGNELDWLGIVVVVLLLMNDER